MSSGSKVIVFWFKSSSRQTLQVQRYFLFSGSRVLLVFRFKSSRVLVQSFSSGSVVLVFWEDLVFWFKGSCLLVRSVPSSGSKVLERFWSSGSIVLAFLFSFSFVKNTVIGENYLTVSNSRVHDSPGNTWAYLRIYVCLSSSSHSSSWLIYSS